MTESIVLYPKNVQHKDFDSEIVPSSSNSISSLSYWMGHYLEAEVIGIQSKNTLEAKGRDLMAFGAWFSKTNGHSQIEDWRPRDTQAFLSELERQGRAATTINRAFATLRRFARWAHEQPNSPFRQGLPTRGIKELAVDEPDCKKLSTRELHRLFKAADNLVLTEKRKNSRPRRNRAILSLLYYTGIRISELTGLKFCQYHDNYLHEVKRKGKSRSKAIYIPSACREALNDYLQSERLLDDNDKTKEPLFLPCDSDGTLRREQAFRALTHIADEANKHAKDDPIHIHPHRLRHTFGAEYREKTGSDTETQKILGHVSLKYVGRYVRKSQEEREAVMESIGEQLG